jgi:glutaminyl-tRNA synthetase
MRDPVLYRIKFAHHHRTGDDWCIYPMYDMAHGQSDSIEKITHSICTLEFVPHRDLYDWCIENLRIFPSKQYEFARRNLSYTVVSKRKLLKLVNEKHVSGWDDPRMPTISAMRRRGYPAAAIREFAKRIGIGKRENIVDLSLLEFCVREELNKTATRAMAVLSPLKVVITNYPDGQVEWMDLENNPEMENSGSHKSPFSKTLFIENEDFMENPPKNYFRLSPGGMVRLKGAFIIQCDEVVKDADGNPVELRCTFFENSRSGHDTSGLKTKGVLHWVSASHAVEAEVRLYDRLFSDPAPDQHEGKDFMEFLNPDSLKVLPNAKLEPFLAEAAIGQSYQFLRLGYFTPDLDSTIRKIVFNRTVTLKDAWTKEQQKES